MDIRRRNPVLLLACLLLFVACGDDDPTGPPAGNDPDPEPIGTLLISSDRVDWGTVAASSSPAVVPITVSVDDDDVGPVSGVISSESNPAGHFRVSLGSGAFTLQPGESLQIVVSYEPGNAGTKAEGAVVFGVEGVRLELAGFSSERPRIRLEAISQDQVAYVTNYKPFVSEDNVRLHSGSGGTYGAGASWIDCASSGGITFNGQGATESKIGFGVRRPSGVSGVRVRVGLEAESNCVQTLIQVDGSENVYEGLSGCHTLDHTYSVPDHTWTDIYVGTDQQGFCGGDLHMRWIEVTYGTALVSEANWHAGF